MPLLENSFEVLPRVEIRPLNIFLDCPFNLEAWQQHRFPTNLGPVIHSVRLFVLMPLP